METIYISRRVGFCLIIALILTYMRMPFGVDSNAVTIMGDSGLTVVPGGRVYIFTFFGLELARTDMVSGIMGAVTVLTYYAVTILLNFTIIFIPFMIFLRPGRYPHV